MHGVTCVTYSTGMRNAYYDKAKKLIDGDPRWMRARHDAAILMAHRPSYLPVIGAEAAGAPPAHVLDVPTGQPALLPSRRGG